MCSAENEDMMHFLTCHKYIEKSITETINVDTDHDHIWEWVLHSDRVFDIRVKISHWIHSRWKSRARAIQLKMNHTPPVTELICNRGVQEQGAIERLPQPPESQLSEEDQLNGEDTGRRVRRGPDRACKKR